MLIKQWKERGPQVLFTLFALSFGTVLLESLAGVGGRTRMGDLTLFLIERPFWMCLFGLWTLFVLYRFGRFSWEAAIERIQAMAPLILLIPLINAVVAWMGFESTVPSFVNVLEAPVSLLTVGWLPRLLASPGVLTVLIVMAIVQGISGWRAKQPPSRFLGTSIVWLLGVLILLLIPSFFSWVVVSASISPLNAGPNVLSRAWVALSQEGYWWRSTLERFPGVVEGEAEASVRLLQLAIGLFIVFISVILAVLRTVQVPIKRVLGWMKPIRAVSFFVAAFFGLWIGRLFGGVFLERAVDAVALGLFGLALLGAWGFSVCRNDLHDERGDRAADRADRPLITAELSTSDLRVLSACFGVLMAVSGWMLGWPVLASMVAFVLLQELLVSPWTRWKERPVGGAILALSAVSIVVSGVFFSLRTAAVPILSARVWLTVAVFYLLQSVPKIARWSPNTLGWMAQVTRLSPRFLVPIALALGYLLVPLLSGWTIVWWIALPCAVVAVLPLLGTGRWDDRKIVGWQAAFIFIAFLLLYARPSP